jgi:hypothetical protein
MHLEHLKALCGRGMSYAEHSWNSCFRIVTLVIKNTDGYEYRWSLAHSLACFAWLALLLCLPSAASQRLFRPSGFCPSLLHVLLFFRPSLLHVLPFFCPFKACSVANLLCLANLRVLTSASPAAVSTLSPSRPLYFIDLLLQCTLRRDSIDVLRRFHPAEPA